MGTNMRKYKVFVEGSNFLISGPSGEAKHGFYTTRYVEAVDSEAAETAAVAQLRSRQSLRDVTRNGRDDPPMIHVTAVDEVATFDGLGSLDQGLVWYPEDG